MPDSLVKAVIREIEPLRASDSIAAATKKVIDAELPALPVVDDDGKFAGIYGEREFMGAFFPGYVNTLTSARMVSRSMDESIDRRLNCREEAISEYMTTDHVLVEDDFSDTHVAELFLHHRVLIIPVATGGKVHAVITRNEFFRQMAARVIDEIEDVGA
jgi:CBS-domain-containing membrane protein